MDILPILLFLLGVCFLILGWRWQNPPNEEALTALKGMAHLKKELIGVQDKLYDLEGKLLEYKLKDIQEAEHKEIMSKEKEIKVEEPKLKEFDPRQIQSNNIDEPNIPKPNTLLSPKYQEVLDLAATGQRIPEIAQRLLISQDAVRMVLRMRPNGGNKS